LLEYLQTTEYQNKNCIIHREEEKEEEVILTIQERNGELKSEQKDFLCPEVKKMTIPTSVLQRIFFLVLQLSNRFTHIRAT
jgi:hypothetical protein